MGFSDRCSNNGFTDRWTCPGCYTDLPDAKAGRHKCPTCGADLKLTTEYEPVSVATVADPDEEDDEE